MKYSRYKSLIINIIFIFKRKFPNSSYFITLFLILKFNGIITLTNPFENAFSSKLTTYNLFHSLTFYAGISRSKLNPIQYKYLCFCIYIIVFFPFLICFVIVFKNGYAQPKQNSKTKHKFKKEIFYNNNSNNDYNNSFNEIKLKLYEERMIHIVLCVFVIICLLSQHLVEILSFCYSSYINQNHCPFQMENKNLIRTIINSFFILIINLYLISFYILLNNKSFGEQSIGFTHYHNNKSLYILITIFNTQAIHYYPVIFNTEKFNIICTIVCEMILFILILCYIKSYAKNNYYTTLYILLVLFAFYSGLLSSLIYVSNTFQLIDNNSYSNLLFILKIIIVVFFTYVSYVLITKYQHNKYDKIIIMNLFSKNKSTSTSDYIYRLLDILDDIKSNTLNCMKLCSLISKHNLICTNQNKCASYLLDIETLLIHLKNKAFCLSNNTHIFNSENEFLNEFLMLILFIENEISNLISSIHMRRKLSNHFDLLLLHCNFVFYYEKNITYSLYILEEYLTKVNSIPFEYFVHFIELKRNILFHENAKTKKSLNVLTSTCKFNTFYLYFKELQQVKLLLYNTCVQYQKLIRYKSIYTHLQSNKSETKNERTIQKSHKNLIDKIFHACMSITNSTQMLKQKLILNFSNKLLANPEMCYLLTAFFELTDKANIKDMGNYFNTIETFEQVDEYESSFEDVNYEHPLIFGMNNNEIIYISEKLSECLLYSANELKGNDVNVLLPVLFKEYHSIEMKRSLLIKQTLSIKKNIFILDKEQYTRRAFVHGGPLPTFSNHILVICDISIIDDNNSDEYLFILNSALDVVSHTRDFEEKYKITSEMCSKLSLNFCAMFGVSFDNVYKTYCDALQCLRNRNLNDLKEVINTFYYCDFNLLVNVYSEDNRNDIQYKDIHINKSKQTLFQFAEKVRNVILEDRSENDWKERIDYLKEISLKEITLNINASFDINISLHYLANYVYFQAKVHDKDKYKEFNLNNTLCGDDNNNNNTLNKVSLFGTSQTPTNYNQIRKPTASNRHLRVMKGTPDCVNDSFIGDSNRIRKYSSAHLSFLKPNSKRCSSNNEVLYKNTNANYSNSNSTQQMLISDNSSQHLSLAKAISLYDSSNPNSMESTVINSKHSSKHLNNKNEQENALNCALTDIKHEDKSITLLLKLKCLSHLERVLLIICYSLLGCVTIMYIIEYILKHEWFGELENFLHINIYIVKLKQYLLDVSINLSQGCYITDNITTGSVDGVSLNHVTIKLLIGAGSNNLFVAYNNLQAFIANFTNEPLIQEINDIIFETSEYVILNDDYTINKYNSTLNEELHYYHYSTGMLSMSTDSFRVCRVKDLFIHNNISSSSIEPTATDAEKAIFYISNNIIIDFFRKLSRMISTACNFLSHKESANESKARVFNICIIIIGSVMYFGFICLVVLYHHKLVLHLKKFFMFHSKSGVFEIQLELFRQMMFNLNYSTSKQFEMSRKPKYKNSYTNTFIRSNFLYKVFNEDNTQSFQKKLLQTFRNTKHSKRFTKYKRMHRHHDTKDESSLTKVPDIITNTNSNTNNSQIHINNFSFSFFSISIVSKSFISVILSLCLFLSLRFASFIENNKLFNNIDLVTQLSFYYTDKVPAHIEILLNHRFSLLNTALITSVFPIENYFDYLPYYNKNYKQMKASIFANEKFIIMGETQMTFLYFRMRMQNIIAKQTEKKEGQSLMPLRNEFSAKLNQKEGVCKIVTDEYMKGGFKMFVGYNESYNLYACYHLGKGAADDGSTNSLESFMFYIQDEYVQFIQKLKSNKISSYNDILSTRLSSDLFLRIYYQFTFVYTPSWIATTDLVQKDIIQLFKDIIIHEIIFYIMELIFCGCFIIVLYLVIIEFLRKKESSFGEMINNLSNIID